MTINTVYFCTSNTGKFTEVKRILEPEFTVVQVKLELDEFQSTDTEYVCERKIWQAANQFQTNKSLISSIDGITNSTNYVIIVEDTGLSITDMNGFPGALVKFYLDYLKPEGICKYNSGSEASMHVTMGVYFSDANKASSITYKMPGIITDKPKGIQGFGFDSVFECTQHPDNLTLAQMMPNVKQEYNPRSECAKQLKTLLLGKSHSD